MADNDLFTRSFSRNQTAYLQKVLMETGPWLIWGKWMKFNTPDKRAVNPNQGPQMLNNTPIVIHRELNKQAKDSIAVPMFRRLKNLPKMGEQQLVGHEEKQKINHAKVYINLLRHGVKTQTSSMQKQITKDIDLAKWAKRQFGGHYADVQAYMGVSHAFYKGFSYNITEDSTWMNSEVSAKSHPHVYVAGSGKVGYSGGYPGSSGYETAIGTAVSALGAGDVFDTDFLDYLAGQPQIRKIAPLYTKDNRKYKIIVAHPYQVKDLKADERFMKVNSQAFVQSMSKENPYLSGFVGFWGDFAIFDGDACVWKVSVSGGDPVWGPSSVSDLDDYEISESDDKFGAIVLGDNAMFKATGSAFDGSLKETQDYGEVVGMAYKVIEGWARPDFNNDDDGTSGQYLINESSAILVTKASAPSA